MSMMKEDREGKTRLTIQEALSIYDVVGLRHELLKFMETEKPVELDLSGVTDCDTAGLQLLFAAWKSAGGRQKTFRIVEASQAVLDTLKAAGLDKNDMFGEAPAV